MIACEPLPEKNLLATIRRHALWVSLLCTLAFHFFFFLRAEELYSLISGDSFYFSKKPTELKLKKDLQKVPVKALPPPPKKKEPLFIAVDPDMKEDREKPEDALVESRVSSLAREEKPDLTLPRGDSRREGQKRMTSTLPVKGSSAPGQKPTPPALQRQQPEEKPAPQEKPQPPADSPRREVMPGQPSPDGVFSTEADKQRDPTRKPDKPTPTEPRVVHIGGGKPAQSGMILENTATSARVAGDRAMAILRARYPEYMEQVLKLWTQSVRRQEVLATTPFKRGSVYFTFGIGEDGSLQNLKLVAPRQDMFAEQELTLTSVKEAAPFPPLTGKMKTDPYFKHIGGELIF
jgi:hypothetical protein